MHTTRAILGKISDGNGGYVCWGVCVLGAEDADETLTADETLQLDELAEQSGQASAMPIYAGEVTRGFPVKQKKLQK